MNKIAITSVLAVMTGLAGAPQAASAGDKALAAVGGFIGGVLVASAANQHYSDQDAYYGYDSYDSRYTANHRYDHRYDRRDHGREYRRDYGRGHRQWVTVRVWVPGRWIVTYDRRGHCVRYYERGHYIIVDRRPGYGRRG